MNVCANQKVLVLWAMFIAMGAVMAPITDAFQGDDHRSLSRVEDTGFNGHCQDAEVAQRFRDFGPAYTVGASVSHGLFAKSFPKLVAGQMCLEEEAYDADFGFLFFYKSSRHILKTIVERRPKIIIAMDYPYHHVKLKRAQIAKPILKNYITMLLLECESELIDCSEDGPYHDLLNDPYRPSVFAGTIYFDCNLAMTSNHEEEELAFFNYTECRQENEKLNVYYRELEERFPKLHLLPAFEILSAFHDSPSGLYRYRINNVDRVFTEDELFFDGFHPRTDPGTYVFANVVIDGINQSLDTKSGKDYPAIPYIPIRPQPGSQPSKGVSSVGTTTRSESTKDAHQ